MSKEDYFDNVFSFFKGSDKESIDRCIICGTKNGFDQREDGQISAIKCECGFVYNCEPPTQKALDEFYNDSKPAVEWTTIKQSVFENSKQKEKYSGIWDFIIDGGLKSVLDVGCGNGFFLNRANCTDKVGIELSESASGYCNFPVYNNYIKFSDSLHQKKEFELITMFGVLEHLKDPHGEVLKYAKHLKKGGHFCVIVPNVRSLVVKTLGLDCCTFCPQHLWYFDTTTLAKLMMDCGFNPEVCYTIEPETQPILKNAKGFHAYANIGIKLTDKDITDQAILKSLGGYKIVAIFKKED